MVRRKLKELTTEAPLVARACVEELITLLGERITEELTTPSVVRTIEELITLLVVGAIERTADHSSKRKEARHSSIQKHPACRREKSCSCSRRYHRGVDSSSGDEETIKS